MDEIEVDIVTINDLDYIVMDEISEDNNTYIYLSNKEDENDFFIRKKDENALLPLENEDEFNKALKLYKDKHMNELI